MLVRGGRSADPERPLVLPFTGAEGIKTARQEAIYGGFAELAFDPCYHQACDTFFNLSHTALDQMSDAAAHAAWTLARSRSAIIEAEPAKNKKGGRHWTPSLPLCWS